MRCARVGIVIAAVIAGSRALAQSSFEDAGPNPFARPEAPRDETQFGAPTANPTFVLRATMQAGDASLVNVDGQILRIGDEIGGYRLASVGEGTAVFMKGEIPYVLAIVEER